MFNITTRIRIADSLNPFLFNFNVIMNETIDILSNNRVNNYFNIICNIFKISKEDLNTEIKLLVRIDQLFLFVR